MSMSARIFLAVFLVTADAFAMGRAPKELPPLDPHQLQIVSIDAGHGGKNEGAVVYGRKEKEIVLEIAQRLREILAERPGLSPLMTRTSDEFVALTDRVLRSEEADAKVFLSLHVDNNRIRKGRGVIVYVYGSNDTIPDGPSREEDERLLPRPPKSQIRRSQRLAAHIGEAMRAHGIKTVSYVDQGPFAVLKSRHIPSVLVELGNLRDRHEAALVSDPDHQKKLATALADSVEVFLRESISR